MTAQTPESKDLWKLLKKRVEENVGTEQAARSADRLLRIKLLCLLALALLSYTIVLSAAPLPLWLSAWALIGALSFLLIANAAHDAAHGTLFRSRAANRASLIGSFALLGIDGALWGLRHIVAHHPHTNVDSVDPDSVPNPYLRLSPHHPWRPWFRFQHIYAVPLYAAALLHTAVVQDFEHLLLRPLPYLNRVRKPRQAMIRALAIKCVYLTMFIALPILAAGHSAAFVLLGVAIQFAAASLLFIITTGLNHYVMETTFYPNSGDRAEESHLLHQLRASADWNAGSVLCCELLGGANVHTAHHLFPGYSHRRYPKITAEIHAFCDEHGLPYNSFSFYEGVRSHFRFLRTLGRRPETDVQYA